MYIYFAEIRTGVYINDLNVKPAFTTMKSKQPSSSTMTTPEDFLVEEDEQIYSNCSVYCHHICLISTPQGKLLDYILPRIAAGFCINGMTQTHLLFSQSGVYSRRDIRQRQSVISLYNRKINLGEVWFQK